jgi:hypothetical protein
LAALDPAPPVISVKGPFDPDARPVCAMVGARNASAIGLRFAGDLARQLGNGASSSHRVSRAALTAPLTPPRWRPAPSP